MKISKEPSVRFAGRGEFLLKEQEEHGSQSLSRTGRRQSRKWKLMQWVTFTSSHACEAEVAAARALQEWLIVQQLQQIGDQEKLKNRMAIKALTHCTHFLTHRHIPHTTNFDKLVRIYIAWLLVSGHGKLKITYVAANYVHPSTCTTSKKWAEEFDAHKRQSKEILDTLQLFIGMTRERLYHKHTTS